MVGELIVDPESADDLDPYYRQHRLLGVGIALGGSLGLAFSLLSALVGSVGLGLAAWAASASGVVVVYGIVHVYLTAGLLQKYHGNRLLRQLPESA